MAVPRIYAHHYPMPKLDVGPRLIGALVGVLCLTVLLIAARLHANASGVETHLQLGLAPCGMLRSTGVPCPACGMTTSFTYLAHGHLLESLATQPAGTLFCVLTAIGFWAGGYVAATGRPSAKLMNQVPVVGLFLSLLGVALVGWAYKIVIVLHG